jgi:iron complex transport system permease protein
MANARTVLALLTIAAGSILLGLALGSTNLVANLLHNTTSATDWQILWELRLPRVLTAFGAGCLLAIAGALMQVLLRNPLADPYVLGISGGAGISVLISLLLGIGIAWRPVFAFIGAALAMSILALLARRVSSWEPSRLIVLGAVMSSFWMAIINVLLILSPNPSLYSLLFWLIGDLTNDSAPVLLCLGALFACALGMRLGPHLDVLQLNQDHARALGLNTTLAELLTYLAAALLTAIAVSFAGGIGFIGLIVPHGIRLLGWRRHRWLLPASALLGGSLLTVADTLGRTLAAPIQLPAGIFTAMIGAPLLLYLLRARAT